MTLVQHMDSLRIQSPISPQGWSSMNQVQRNADVDISFIDIVLVCNDDLRLASRIVNQLRKHGATKIRLSCPENHIKVRNYIFNHCKQQ